jgi:hypothetical protein
MRGIASLSKSVLAGVVAFVATSAVIVTFAVTSTHPPSAQAPQPASDPASSRSPSSSSDDQVDAGVGTQAESSDEQAPDSGNADAASSSSEDLPGPPDPLESAVGRKLDPSLVTLLDGDVPTGLGNLLPPVGDLPQLELAR